MTTFDITNATSVMLLVMLVSAVYTDLRTHRISNVLVVAVMFIALTSQLGSNGGAGVIDWISGLAVGFVIFIPFYIGGGMGAGDVKLMAAVTSFLGPLAGVLACGAALLAGLPLVALALTARHLAGAAEDSVSATAQCGQYGHGAHHQRESQLLTTREGQARRIPYAAAVATGALVGLWWSGRLAQLTGVLIT